MNDVMEIRVDAERRAWIDGEEIVVPPSAGSDVVGFVTGLAAQVLTSGQECAVDLEEASGEIVPLTLHSDGTTERRSATTPPPATAPIPVTDTAADTSDETSDYTTADTSGDTTADTSGASSTPTSEGTTRPRRSARASFLVEERREQPATAGWRGLLNRAGTRIGPSATELSERADVRAVSQHWPGPRTIAIVNGKGGANKTPTTALLAAVFARHGGAGVLAWDNNETRGTLGWRTEQGPHDATVQSLLPATKQLLSPSAQSSDLAHHVHHQTSDKYDVLRSNPALLATEQRITADDFDALHAVAAKYYRLVFVDSGNNESAEHWLRMIDHTDQLVIATTALGEHAEAGALLLEALHDRDPRSAALAKNAVVIVSQSEKPASTSAENVAEKFAPLARAAVTIPFDENFHSGQLRYDVLAPRTRRAWLAAAAAVAEGLTTPS